MLSLLKKYWPYLIFGVCLGLIFRSWFTLQSLSAGDAGFYFDDNLRQLNFRPYLWNNSGLGYVNNTLQAMLYFVWPLKFLSWIGLPWIVIEKITWYWLFLGLTIYSAWIFSKTFGIKGQFRFFTVAIYLFNSYILMIIGGGQISIALAYAIFPLVVSLFIKTFDQSKLTNSILIGLIFGVQIAFDARLALLALIVIIFYWLWNYSLRIFTLLRGVVFPVIIALVLHSYWILPFLVLKRQPYGVSVVSSDWVSYLSFANFSNSLSLLQPNWPENIFGKTYFFRPEFLVLPLFAFGTLLFYKSKTIRTQNLLFFTTLALIGVFLGKGNNPPFGGVYSWLFNHLPGMNTFRDPIKFYVLIAISYSYLIALFISEVSRKISFKKRVFFLFVITGLMLFTIRPAILGKLNGTFRRMTVPAEDMTLKNWLDNQTEYFRVLWIPGRPRFGPYSNRHPAVEFDTVINRQPCLPPFCPVQTENEEWGKNCPINDRCYVKEFSFFLNPQTESTLRTMAIKYIVVPYDLEGNLFVANYKFNSQQRIETETLLDTIPWLTKIQVENKIAVYEVNSPRDLFYSEPEVAVEWQEINPTKFSLRMSKQDKQVKLVFAQSFDELWQVKTSSQLVSSQKVNEWFNSFMIIPDGNEIMVEYRGQDLVDRGMIISATSLIILIISLIIL